MQDFIKDNIAKAKSFTEALDRRRVLVFCYTEWEDLVCDVFGLRENGERLYDVLQNECWNNDQDHKFSAEYTKPEYHDDIVKLMSCDNIVDRKKMAEKIYVIDAISAFRKMGIIEDDIDVLIQISW